MKSLLLASVVAMLAVTTPVAAHADGPGYVGTCRISTINDSTPGGQLGGDHVWTGEANVLVAPKDPTATITAASCWIKVFGSSSETKLLDATVVGPVAVGAGPVTFTAAVTDTVFLCTHVSVNGGPTTDSCGFDEPTTPICPESVCGDGGVLGQVFATVNEINDETKVVDQVVCPLLIGAAPTVDGLPTAGVLYVDPVTGDTYLGGTTDASLFWDCPPYLGTP